NLSSSPRSNHTPLHSGHTSIKIPFFSTSRMRTSSHTGHFISYPPRHGFKVILVQFIVIYALLQCGEPVDRFALPIWCLKEKRKKGMIKTEGKFTGILQG